MHRDQPISRAHGRSGFVLSSLARAQARREAGKFDLSADTGACVLKLGTSADLGFCAALKKAGKPWHAVAPRPGHGRMRRSRLPALAGACRCYPPGGASCVVLEW